MNTAAYLIQHRSQARVALVTGQEEVTFADLNMVTAQVAGHLRRLGVVPGDTVAFVGGNSLFTVGCYLGIMRLGAVAVPLPTTLSTNDFVRRVSLAHANIVCLEQPYHTLSTALPDHVHIIMEAELLKTQDMNSFDFSYFQVRDHDTAALMFTSGSTAEPKAVMISHRNIQANTESIIQAMEVEPDDTMIVILPFSYCFGASLLHTHLRVGAKCLLTNAFAFPETVVQEMAKHRVTSLAAVPYVVATLLRKTSFGRRILPSLTKIQVAGGALPPAILAELRGACPQARIFLMYGQTEATARLSYLPPHMIDAKSGSIGKGLPGVQLRVLRDDGRPVQPGEQGEIVAYGENIAEGYLGDPEATADRFRGGLHTGDIAKVDKDGYIYIQGRTSEFVKPYGIRVSTKQVADCVYELHDVTAVWVEGVPDIELGEAIAVNVTIRRGSVLTSRQVIAHCRQRLPGYMVPKIVSFVDEPPLNAFKIVKGTQQSR